MAPTLGATLVATSLVALLSGARGGFVERTSGSCGNFAVRSASACEAAATMHGWPDTDVHVRIAPGCQTGATSGEIRWVSCA